MKIQAGDKVVRDATTGDNGKVKLGDIAPAFPISGKIQIGDKVIRDATTHNEGKARLGDIAPAFPARR